MSSLEHLCAWHCANDAWHVPHRIILMASSEGYHQLYFRNEDPTPMLCDRTTRLAIPLQ